MSIGLLFAPAVLDTTGFFSRAADWIERTTQRLYSISSKYLPKVAKLVDSLAGRGFVSVLFCLFFGVVFSVGLLLLGTSVYVELVISMIPIAIFVGLVEIVRRIVKRNKIDLLQNIMTTVILPFVFPLIICLIPLLFLVRLVLQVTSTISSGIHGTVSQREEFRSAIIRWGILIFTMESLLQFIASF